MFAATLPGAGRLSGFGLASGAEGAAAGLGARRMLAVSGCADDDGDDDPASAKAPVATNAAAIRKA
jgi:hypothetical protein